MKRRLEIMELDIPTKKDYLVERNPRPLGVALNNPYAVGKCDRSDIVTLAEEIANADNFVKATTVSKLQMIAEQMKFLQDQARRILLEAKESVDLNHAACNFQKKPGNTYYLYQRDSGQKYFSMLSPQDWNLQGEPPHQFIGAYVLEKDMSWTPVENVRKSSITDMKKMIEENVYESLACKGCITESKTEGMDVS